MNTRTSRRGFLKSAASYSVLALAGTCPNIANAAWESEEELYVSRDFTATGGFTEGAEGPACDINGNLYAVNFNRQGTIGRVTPDGDAEVFVELPAGSIGNGIRFGSDDTMYIADYTAHNILAVEMNTREVTVFAHEPTMNQPNDIAIASDDTLFASDPNWRAKTGNVWRIGFDGSVTKLDNLDNPTNGIEVSPDEKILYVNDPNAARIFAYDLSPSWEVSNRRLIVDFDDSGSDGMRCDIDGNLYVTRNGIGKISKVAPDGSRILDIPTIGRRPSNIAFGGPDGCTCYVTMADRGNIETFRVGLPGRSWQMFRDRATSVVSSNNTAPAPFRLADCYPNPFNPATTVSFTADEAADIRIDVFTITGQKAVTLHSGRIASGKHSIQWNASGFPSGVYIVRLAWNGGSMSSKATLLR